MVSESAIIENLVNKLIQGAQERASAEARMLERIRVLEAAPPYEAPYSPLRFVGSPDAVNKLMFELSQASAEYDRVLKEAEGKLTNDKVDDRGKVIRPGATFDYADMAALLNATRPALARHGICVMQSPQIVFEAFAEYDAEGKGKGPVVRQGVCRLTTVVAGHGARIESDIDLPPAGDIKALGGNITYIRRYAYQSTLGLHGETDADDKPLEQAHGRPQTAPAVDGPRGARGQMERGPASPNPELGSSLGSDATSRTQARAQQAPIEAPQGRAATHAANGSQESRPAPSAEAQQPVKHESVRPPAAADAVEHVFNRVYAPGDVVATKWGHVTIEYGPDGIKPALLELRNKLWDRLEGGTAASTKFQIAVIGKGIRDMDLTESHALLLAFRKEINRRHVMTPDARKALYEGRA